MEKNTVSSKLIKATTKISGILHQIKEINSITKLIAINTAIESSRSSQLSESFSTLSLQVKTLYTRSEESFIEINSLIENLRTSCASAIAVRLGDIAVDIIDKIDRNLFERNCDVQAWSTFKSIISACKTEDSHLLKISTKNMQTLVDVYEVYHDLLLLNKKGIVIAAAKHQHLVGIDMSDRLWFRSTLFSNSVHVSDMYYSKSISNYTISYSAPVRDEKGNVIGVISSRFNWEYIYDILKI